MKALSKTETEHGSFEELKEGPGKCGEQRSERGKVGSAEIKSQRINRDQGMNGFQFYPQDRGNPMNATFTCTKEKDQIQVV